MWGVLEAGERLMLTWEWHGVKAGGQHNSSYRCSPMAFPCGTIPCCAAGWAELPGNQICMNRMFGPTTSALGSFKKMGDKNISHVGGGLLESAPGDP